MDKIDKLINFYYEDVSDAERFTLRALLASFGVSSFNAGRTSTFNVSADAYSSIIFKYPNFDEYLNQLKDAKD